MTESEVKGILEGGGPNGFRFDKIRLGSGVVGKLTNAVLALLAMMTVAAWGLSRDPIYLLGLVGLGFAAFVFYVLAALWFASRNPSWATLEGAELIAYRRMEMADKVGGPIIEQAVEPDVTPQIGRGIPHE